MRRRGRRLWRISAAEEAWAERWADARVRLDAVDLTTPPPLTPRPKAQGPTDPDEVPASIVLHALASSDPVVWLSHDFQVVPQADAFGYVEVAAVHALVLPLTEMMAEHAVAVSAPGSFRGDVFTVLRASGNERAAACERLARRFAKAWKPRHDADRQTDVHKALVCWAREEGSSLADLKYRLMLSAVWWTFSRLDSDEPMRIRVGNRWVKDRSGAIRSAAWREHYYVHSFYKFFLLSQHCVVHEILDMPEPSRVRNVVSLDDLQEHEEEGSRQSAWLTTEAGNPLDLLMRKETIATTLAALDRLPATSGHLTRQLLTLLQDGRTVAAAARVLGISEAYARQLRKRAKDHVRKRLG